jgi:hypothetical protein
VILFRRGVGVLLACVATWGLVALSDVEWRPGEGDDAWVRLSWRSVGERIEECRSPTEEELAALPLHMRRSEICEGRLAPSLLVVELDGERLVEREVHAAGARRDRPTYVFEELPVRPGRHHLRITFSVLSEGIEGDVEAPLVLDEEIAPGPRQIVLVTRLESDDAGPARLVARRGADSPGS